MALFVDAILAEGTAHLPLEHGGEVLLEAPGHETLLVFAIWIINREKFVLQSQAASHDSSPFMVFVK